MKAQGPNPRNENYHCEYENERTIATNDRPHMGDNRW